MEIPNAPEDFSPQFISEHFLPVLNKEVLALTIPVPNRILTAMAESADWSFLNFGRHTPPTEEETAQKKAVEDKMLFIVRSQVEFEARGIVRFRYQDEDIQDGAINMKCRATGLIKYHCDHTPDYKMWSEDCEIIDRVFTLV